MRIHNNWIQFDDEKEIEKLLEELNHLNEALDGEWSTSLEEDSPTLFILWQLLKGEEA